jgi:hypothetical protein
MLCQGCGEGDLYITYENNTHKWLKCFFCDKVNQFRVQTKNGSVHKKDGTILICYEVFGEINNS